MKTSSLAVVDKNDQPLNRVASYEEVHRLGLWHRGVHAIIYTPDKEVLMQKRSPSLAYHPREVEISVGGAVESGESPEQAIIREIDEEFGLKVQPNQLRFIGKSRYNHRVGPYRSRTIIYSYAACLPKSEIRVTINPSETSSAFFMKEQTLRLALRRHRIKSIGRISSLYAYWRRLLAAM